MRLLKKIFIIFVFYIIITYMCLLPKTYVYGLYTQVDNTINDQNQKPSGWGDIGAAIGGIIGGSSSSSSSKPSVTPSKPSSGSSSSGSSSSSSTPSTSTTPSTPEPESSGSSDSGTGGLLEDIFNIGDSWINEGKGQANAGTTMNTDILQSTSDRLYNMLLAIATVIAVIVGAILGVQFMTAGIDKKIQVKEALFPYMISCIVVFGAFGIWKLIVSIMALI